MLVGNSIVRLKWWASNAKVVCPLQVTDWQSRLQHCYFFFDSIRFFPIYTNPQTRRRYDISMLCFTFRKIVYKTFSFQITALFYGSMRRAKRYNFESMHRYSKGGVEYKNIIWHIVNICESFSINALSNFGTSEDITRKQFLVWFNWLNAHH